MGGLYVARSRELVELVVLGLACERPRHPYDMLQQVRQRGNTSFLRGLPRSLYHAVDALAEQGLVEAGAVTSEGGRPERTPYAATPAGRDEYRARMLRLLATPSDQATFHAVISLIAGLDPHDVADALDRRAAGIDAALEQATARYDEAISWLPRIVLIEVEYLRSQLEAERDWVRMIAAQARSGELSWKLEFGTPPGGGPSPFGPGSAG
ncbi:MAG: PadR family transcriptional regulator [Thermoleophilia bacterium]|nr:PadR family transcriptional regulator [Thermoleophilia bacterium]